MGKTPWNAVSVYLDGEAFLPLAGSDRMAVLLLWYRGEEPPNARFSELKAGVTLTDPTDVDWFGFPKREALAAAELMRSRRPSQAKK